MKKYLVTLFTIVCATVSGQQFDCICGDIALTTGYRNDRITTDVNAFDPPETLILQDNLKGKNINIFEIGFKGRVCLCEYFLKGFANFGWVGSGHYEEDVSAPGKVTSESKGHIHKGRTRDYSIGLGYMFTWNCINISPLIGYSYDYQRIKMGKITVDGFPDAQLSNLKYDMRWQGPWIGLESEFDLCCIDFTVGYEYHWSDWRANWTLAGPDIFGVAFSDKRKSHHAYGNVVYIDGTYCFCNCWEVGLGLKYQYWKATKGKLQPRNGTLAEAVGSSTEVDKVPKATWSSFQIQLSLGYNF